MSNPVEDLLIKHGVRYMPSGKDFLTKCFNPDHNDSNPSFRIDRASGIAHCFSCGFKTNLFKYYGIFSQPTSIKVAKLKEKLNKLRESLYGVDMPAGATPFTKSFRDVSLKTLKHFGAFYTHSVEALADRIIFPVVNLTGKPAGYIARHMHSNGNPRYIVYPSEVSLPLLPCKLDVPAKSIVLVEGIFDLLNMYDKGITNVVCVFGTVTLKHNTAEKLLPFKAAGVERIYLMFDGDDAGAKGAKELKPILEDLGYVVEIVHLQEDTDPGDLSQEDINAIKEYIK